MVKIRIVKFRIPKFCICPECQIKQRLYRDRTYYKTVKDMDLDQEKILKVRMIVAKCTNPDCKRYSFTLPVPGIEKYKRSTKRLSSEAIAGIIQDNSTLRRISRRLRRSFNTTGSKSTIQRWIEQEADKYHFKDIIPRLGFSGILCLDEYWPRRSKTCDLISSDRLSYRILYIENIPHHHYEYVESHLNRLKLWGIDPYAIIFDMWQPYPHTAEKIFPNALIQYDYFHVIKRILYYLRRALGHYMTELTDQKKQDLHRILWRNRYNIIKNVEDRTLEQEGWIKYIYRRFNGTIVPEILVFKEKVRDIFKKSTSKADAIKRRDKLIVENWHKKDKYFGYVIKYLASNYQFNYMTTYLDNPPLARAGNSETVISIWRQMEAVRYGFKSNKGRQDHLKLYQLTRYLNEEI